MSNNKQYFLDIVKHPVKFRMFLFFKLPAAFFAGVRFKNIDENFCSVTVPYKWFSKNPFKSTYFACLSMAGEMSSGLLAMTHVYKRTPAVSMLVVVMEATYFKKATGVTTFVCRDGSAIKEAIEKAIDTGEAVALKTTSIGKNEKGEDIAAFYSTWSFKVKATHK
jgi:phage terminase large subunit-like protein